MALRMHSGRRSSIDPAVRDRCASNQHVGRADEVCRELKEKIFCTTMPPSTPGRLAPWMMATYISSAARVPMFAGRKPFSATAAA
jgi:hypothetical protein